MKNYLIFCLMFLGIIFVQAQDLSAELSTEIGDAWKAAYEAGDTDALSVLYADKVEFVNEDGSVSTATRAQVVANWEQSFEKTTGTMEFTSDLVATELPDGKVSLTGSFTQTTTNKETGESEEFNGLYEHQAVKVDGKWQLCRMKVMPQ